jgi:hypothetical protein
MKKAANIDELYRLNEGQNLTGPSGNAVGAFLAVAITNSCPILQQLMSNAVALKPVLPIFQVLGWWITHIPRPFWTSIADKRRFWTENADMFSAQLAA